MSRAWMSYTLSDSSELFSDASAPSGRRGEGMRDARLGNPPLSSDKEYMVGYNWGKELMKLQTSAKGQNG